MPGAVVIGAGPGIGRSVARRFAAAGMPVALIARSRATVDAAAEAVEALGVRTARLPADVSDAAALRGALDAAAEALGPPDVVVYNAAVVRADRPGELDVRGHEHAWSVNVVGALTAAAHVAPELARRGGAFLVTGGMPEPKAEYVSLSLGKAGVRTLVELLHQEYGSRGLRVASVTVAGPVAPGTAFDPDEIAECYWQLHARPASGWQREVRYDGRPDRSGPAPGR
ncbi:SDR family NAD(P)-dependent oxidoreductase [Yinghuangia sp. ASG 101]|uniref:SDR family NAD(P)-dependent oxidoreductase n=1 Tax=Yinghuangia sp. ASG 101 TaxID=2896848 RepID=UPI001E53DEB3|nr:SDR family NAD(P)-dependent oxidoreductase [Yinghuangia sp. ASG 101]UGQ09301.1 SDR family NAD(P)-dependent oxidoreductase [Yinghuangia sp. ASG 101]